MEVCDDEIGVGDVNVDADGGQDEAGQSSDGEQADEAEGIEHRSSEADRTFVESRGPVEYFHCGRHANHETQERKNHRGVKRDAGHEKVMRPDQESENRDGYAGKRNKLVSEHSLARKTRDEFADHSHGS